MRRQSFAEKVYALTAQIPKGKVSTYKAIARQLKCRAYRAVGRALNKNPYAPKVPCHRIINADGRIGGFASGIQNKRRILEKEGIQVTGNKINLEKYSHEWR